MPDPVITGKSLPHEAEAVLREILAACGLSGVFVTSVGRTVEDQSRIMFDNLVAHGVAAQLGLYRDAGDKVIWVYEQFHSTLPPASVQELMAEEIRKVGPGNVSHHITDANHYVFDVAPSSIPAEKREAFIVAAATHPRVSKFLKPPADPAMHLEVIINPVVA